MAFVCRQVDDEEIDDNKEGNQRNENSEISGGDFHFSSSEISINRSSLYSALIFCVSNYGTLLFAQFKYLSRAKIRRAQVPIMVMMAIVTIPV